MRYKIVGKRLFDLLLIAVALLPFVVMSIMICSVSIFLFKGSVFFFQERLGYRNKVFRLFKFATLLPEKDGDKVLSIQERQTSWGKFLRDYSLDELPQLLNILKGEMSFVGPRPLLPEYKNMYTPEEAIRHTVKPGLTGLAQVRGRNSLTWNEKMGYDQQYVASLSLEQDLRILIETVAVVCKGQAVNYGKKPEVKNGLNWSKS